MTIADEPSEPARASLAPVRVVLAVVALLAVVLAGLVGYRLAGGGRPAESSPEAGFARDMQVHHGQAIEMSKILYDKTDDPRLRVISYDILTTQAQQSGQLYGWLADWGLPQSSDEAPMAWMSGSTHGHAESPTTGSPTSTTSDETASDETTADGMGHGGREAAPAMPGMASPESITRLKSLEGREAEALFLRLMIEHHKGGVVMANGILDRTDRGSVRVLAQAIATAQRSEITLMEGLLEDLDPTP